MICDCGELGDISDYDDETLEKANEAFFLWEDEQEYEKAIVPLHFAAKRRYSFAMGRYGCYCLTKKIDLEFASECLLMAALRGEEWSCEFIEPYLKALMPLLNKSTIKERNVWLKTGKKSAKIRKVIEKLVVLITSSKG